MSQQVARLLLLLLRCAWRLCLPASGGQHPHPQERAACCLPPGPGPLFGAALHRCCRRAAVCMQTALLPLLLASLPTWPWSLGAAGRLLCCGGLHSSCCAGDVVVWRHAAAAPLAVLHAPASGPSSPLCLHHAHSWHQQNGAHSWHQQNGAHSWHQQNGSPARCCPAALVTKARAAAGAHTAAAGAHTWHHRHHRQHCRNALPLCSLHHRSMSAAAGAGCFAAVHPRQQSRRRRWHPSLTVESTTKACAACCRRAAQTHQHCWHYMPKSGGAYGVLHPAAQHLCCCYHATATAAADHHPQTDPTAVLIPPRQLLR